MGQAAMRKISSFEIIDGDWTKEYIWQFRKEEKEIDFFITAAGIDSYLYMFTFGLPIYLFTLAVFYALIAALFSLNCNKCKAK